MLPRTKTCIHGVSALMKTFNYLFGKMLREMILRHTDNLSSTLQNKNLLASESQQIARMTLDTLQTLRTDASFDLFWIKVSNLADTQSIPEAQLSQQRKQPRTIATRSSGHSHATPYLHYRQQYHEALDRPHPGMHEGSY